MARKPSALASIFEDEAEATKASTEPTSTGAAPSSAPALETQTKDRPAASRRSSHPGKKAVLIHIPEDMHRTLRQLSVEEGGEPLTVITERLLRQYLVQRGHTRFAP